MEYIVTFLEGIASFISPCLLPMVPIYISYFIGEDDNSNKKAILNSIGFANASCLYTLFYRTKI